MTDREKMMYELQSNAIFIKHKSQRELPTYESGVVSPIQLGEAQAECATEGIKWAFNHLVKTKKNYPKHGLTKVELEIDAVALPAHVFNKLIRHLDE